MEPINAILNWLNDNVGTLTVLLALLPLVWASYTFLSVKKQELRERRFAAFHRLIQSLVESEKPDLPMKLDRQIAIVFELRNFQEYFPVTLRIFKGLKQTWANYGPDENRTRLHTELDLAIAYIERKI